jgi:hypothetical protein
MSPQLRHDVSTTDTDHGLVLLDERTGRYWQLNRTGTLVLRSLLDGATLEDAARTLASRYAVTPREATGDVTAMLEHLRASGLIVP